MKRYAKSGIGRLSGVILMSIMMLDFKLDKRLKRTMADIVAAMLINCSVNSSVIARLMAGKERRADSMYRVFNRFVSNSKIRIAPIMTAFASRVLEILAAGEAPVVFMMDQSRIKRGRECLMISIRFGKRALPFVWLVADTKGAIGFDLQKKLLDEFYRMLPAGIKVLFTADRFYGTEKLINYCKRRKWGYRVRLKGNLKIRYKRKTFRTSEICDHYEKGCIESCRLYGGSHVKTSIVVLSDRNKKYKEPWIIAMDGSPTKKKAREYGKRWGIEAMFSDLKSRGFRITSTHLKDPQRIERLILLCSIALYFAISTSLEHDPKKPVYTEAKTERSKLSDFTEGMRRILTVVTATWSSIPMLWEFLHSLPTG